MTTTPSTKAAGTIHMPTTTTTKQTSPTMDLCISGPQSAKYATAVIASNGRGLQHLRFEQTVGPVRCIRVVHAQLMKWPAQLRRKARITCVYNPCFALCFDVVLEIQDVIRLQPAITQHNTKPSTRCKLVMLLRKIVASGAEGTQFAQIVGAIEAELVRRLGSIGTRAARVDKEESHNKWQAMPFATVR